MIYFNNTTEFYLDGPAAVTLGKFDGVHRGHQKLMRKILEYAARGAAGVVFVFNPRRENLILTEEEQKEVIESLGMDCLVRCPFVPEISSMEPSVFIQNILLNKLHAKHIVVGTDFRFGHNRAGDAAYLQAHAKEYGFSVDVITKEVYGGREISSTYLREAVSRGDMPLYGALAGRSFSVTGTVIHGRHLGTSMGMPTANIIPAEGKLLPPDGVYVSVSYVDGKAYPGVTDIGNKPTVAVRFRGVETHLLDQNMDLYGKVIRTELLSWIRPERKFETLAQLQEQIGQDIQMGRKYFFE